MYNPCINVSNHLFRFDTPKSDGRGRVDRLGPPSTPLLARLFRLDGTPRIRHKVSGDLSFCQLVQRLSAGAQVAFELGRWM
jgi:hypothetical protein